MIFGFLVWGIIMKLKYNHVFIAGCLFGLSLCYKQTMLLGYPFLFIFLCFTNEELVRLTKGFIFSIFLLVLSFLIVRPLQFIKATIVIHLTRLDATDFSPFSFRL
ncbi:MAG: hypothetical protein NZO16_05525 [Deltaproteobacteria bacterium]|nr:hypothetical protein [Deltaproteobacteria bacterium]